VTGGFTRGKPGANVSNITSIAGCAPAANSCCAIS
jgi:hypothetical protein